MSPPFFSKQITMPNWIYLTYLGFTLILMLVLVALIVGQITEVYAEPAEYVFAGGEKGNRMVPVYYVETVYCDDFNIHDVGCYHTEHDYITIKIGYRDIWTPRGCTVLQHEQTHAWGFYDEVSVSKLFQCDNPNDKSETEGLYDADNFFHFNPMYIWKGYGLEMDPTANSWYIGERSWNVGEQD